MREDVEALSSGNARLREGATACVEETPEGEGRGLVAPVGAVVLSRLVKVS